MENVFWEAHCDLPQQGPGDDYSTLKALALIPGLPDKPEILDIGCGPGRQTMALVRYTNGRITALDNHQPFLDEVRRRAEALGVADRVTVKNCSMSGMDFEEKSFDLIWSEGALYVMGFRRGLDYCRRFLKSGGFIVVTEVSWFIEEQPVELYEFWNAEYPDIRSVDQNLKMIEELGYHLVTSFPLPESAWLEGYYYPLGRRIKALREKYAENKETIACLDNEEREIEIFEKYSGYYGYVFYVMQAV